MAKQPSIEQDGVCLLYTSRVRGVVMNPVDHPMGGGEGRASGGLPRSRKGLLAKGLKTRAPKKASSKYIIERRKK